MQHGPQTDLLCYIWPVQPHMLSKAYVSCAPGLTLHASQGVNAGHTLHTGLELLELALCAGSSMHRQLGVQSRSALQPVYSARLAACCIKPMPWILCAACNTCCTRSQKCAMYNALLDQSYALAPVQPNPTHRPAQ